MSLSAGTPSLLPIVVPFGVSGNLSNVQDAVTVFSNGDGNGGITFTMTAPSGGTITFEGTFDTFNWFPMTLRRVGNDGYVQQTTGVDSYVGSIVGAQAFRTRTTTSGFAAGTIIGTMHKYINTLEGIENGPPNEFFLNIAEGKVAGYTSVNKFGRNANVNPLQLPVDIWNGLTLYPGFPSNVFDRVRVSSNQTGDHGLGFGARTMTINGLDAAFVQQTEAFTLSGLNPVTGIKTFSRVNSAYINTAGTSGVNIGEVTCTHIPPNQADLFFRLPTGCNQTYESAYTVPAGITAYIRSVHSSMNRGTGAGTPVTREADICFATRVSGSVFRLRRPVNLSNTAPLEYTIGGGLAMQEKTDIIMRCTTASDSSDISCAYDMILVDN